MVIRGTEQVSLGVYKITPDAGPAFFLRTEYLSQITEDRLVPVDGGLGKEDSLFVSPEDLKPGMNGVFSEEDSEDIIQAGRTYSAEKAAMEYLSRAEQCRFSLEQKLLKKNFSKESIDSALNFIEEKGYLDDLRFAKAWLSTRYIDHAEGRRKLLAELLSRGIDRTMAKEALDEHFEEHPEAEQCIRAVKKYLRTHSSPDTQKLQASLFRSGFSHSQIKNAMQNFSLGLE